MATKVLRKYKVCTMNRLNNSVNGNPRFALTLQDVETEEFIQCKTQTDSSYGYCIENSDYRDYFMASLRYTKAGKCIIEKLEKAGK